MLTWLRALIAPRPTAEADAPQDRRRLVEVGWLISAEKATFVYDAPRPVARKGPMPANAKAVGFCPAVIDHEARLYEILCPFDLRLRLGRNDKGQLGLVNAAGRQSAMASGAWQSMVKLLPHSDWRAPERPLVRVAAPWRFLADEPVWLLQMPPFNHFRDPPWPGVMIGARFPIHIWPRSLSWLFEWHQPEQELELRRGEPWFYLRFETEEPSRPLRLVEAEATPELQEYCSGLDRTDSFVKDESELFAAAAARRPRQLLKRRAER